MTRLLLSLMLCFQFVCLGLAQQPTQPSARDTEQKPAKPSQQPSPDDDVVKITTNLVQIDAVVTDKLGNPITDLRPEDVEMLEDGKVQKISNFSYVKAAASIPPPAATSNRVENLIPEPPRSLRPEQVQRTIALVVDDLGMSFESAYHLRRALRKFLNESMQPNDQVAIIRTSSGVGALQQFTTNKELLHAAVESVKWYPQGRGNITAFAPLRNDGIQPRAGEDTTADEELSQFREDVLTVGTLGALSYVVRGLRQLPGRKSVILFSDGITLYHAGDPLRAARIGAAMRVLLDLANRASVVINTMDLRGLQTVGFTAADSSFQLSPDMLQQQLSVRRSVFLEGQQGLDLLAERTGGVSIKNSNDLGSGLKRIVEAESGYYLIGYRPDDATFERYAGRAKFHHVSLKIKRPGKYNVRMRSGFYGVSDEKVKPAESTPQQQLISALLSPFSAAGVRLRLTSLFGNDAVRGSLMRSFLHVNARDLTFTREPDGTHKAVFDIIAVTLGENGANLGEFNYRHTIRIKEENLQKVLKNGFTYNMTLAIKKPGAYQLRTALRDVDSSKIGSASQFISVPDIKKDRLLTSGLLVQGISSERYAQGLLTRDEITANDIDDIDPLAGSAVRQFHRGMAMVYGLVVYNTKIDKTTGKPQLKSNIRLFRDGQLIFTGRETPFDPSLQTDMKRLEVGGAIKLGSDMAPGEYVIQMIVTDLLRKDKKQVVTQSMDFEIVH